MEEVVEISAVSKNYEFFADVLAFLERYLEKRDRVKKISVMDNWLYENCSQVEQISEIEEYIESKIVVIEETAANGQIGVSIEKYGNYYILEGWINKSQGIVRAEYESIIDSLVKRFQKTKEIVACGIGREIMVNYGKGIGAAIIDAHNIDLWLISEAFFNDVNGNPVGKGSNASHIVIKGR